MKSDAAIGHLFPRGVEDPLIVVPSGLLYEVLAESIKSILIYLLPFFFVLLEFVGEADGPSLHLHLQRFVLLHAASLLYLDLGFMLLTGMEGIGGIFLYFARIRGIHRIFKHLKPPHRLRPANGYPLIHPILGHSDSHTTMMLTEVVLILLNGLDFHGELPLRLMAVNDLINRINTNIIQDNIKRWTVIKEWY